MLVMQIILNDKLILYQQSTVKKRNFSPIFCLSYKHFDNQFRKTISPGFLYMKYLAVLVIFSHSRTPCTSNTLLIRYMILLFIYIRNLSIIILEIFLIGRVSQR